MNYLSTYRLSQDHIELFSALSGNTVGTITIPLLSNFVVYIKKALCHLELRSSFTGNCSPMDNFSILSSLSALEAINPTTSRFRDTDAGSTINELQSAEDEQYVKLTVTFCQVH